MAATTTDSANSATFGQYLAPNTATTVRDLPVAQIRPSPLNPRRHFDETALAELADSLKEHGLIEPIVVRQILPSSDAPTVAWELIAGERRWRAAQLAGLTHLPARILHDVDDATALRLALVENLQRADLDPIEEAEGYRQLNRVCGLKQAQIAQTVNRSQPAIANSMRLLDLPEDVQERIRKRELTPSHGVALARYKGFPDVVSKLAELAVAQHWTSAELERKSLLSDYRVLQTGVVRPLWHPAIFDKSICERCPFDARRNDGGIDVCLKPDHYDELEAAARAEREAAAKANIEAAREAGVDTNNLPQLRDMRWDAFEQLNSWPRLPTGCTESCPCRGQAVGHNGEVVAICTNPRRFRSLQSQDKKAEQKRRQERHGAALAILRERMDALESIGSRELAVLLMALLRAPSYGYSMREHAEAAAKTYCIAVDTVGYEPWPQNAPHFDELARHGELDLLRLTLETVLRHDLAGQMEAPASAGAWATWYLRLGDDSAAADGEAG